MFLKPKLEVISGDDFEMIHQATLRLLEDIGIVFHHDEVLKIFKDHGATVDGNLVRLPQKLVEERAKMAPSKFRWQARNNQRTVVMGEGPVLQPAAGPVYVHDLNRGRRSGTLQDYTNLQKIYQAEDVFDLVGMISCEPSDVSQDRKHLDLMLEILRHTDKPVNGFMTTGKQARAQLDMMEIAMGRKNALEQHHCIAVSIGATSPLTYTWDPLETLLQYVRRNQMAHLLNEAVGILDNILTVSYEKTIIDGELISRVKRIMQGIDGADREVNIDVIRETGHGGNFLLHESTLNHCRDRWRASLSYCGNYNDWEKEGARDIMQRASKTYNEILEAAPDSLIDPALEEELEAYIKSELR